MAVFTAPQRETLDGLVDEFLAHYSRGRTLFAVDGVDAAGKTTFADGLAERFAQRGHVVVRASIDGFHRPRAERYARGRESAEGYYRDSFDLDVFRRFLIEPFRLGGSTGFATAMFDVEADAPRELRWTTTGPDATLLVDGVFLLRPELRGLWHYSVWLDVPADVAEARLVARDGAVPVERYRGGQELYRAEAHPAEAASAIVDNTDPLSPRRIFRDRC